MRGFLRQSITSMVQNRNIWALLVIIVLENVGQLIDGALASGNIGATVLIQSAGLELLVSLLG